MQARERVSRAQEAPEQAVSVEIAGEELDAAAQADRARVPIGAGDGIEALAKNGVVGLHVGARIGAAEEPQERFVVGQMPQRGQFETAEGDMRAVEVDGDDFGGVGGQIGKRVAPARGDGDDAVLWADFERFEIDDRVFPYLRIDQAAKRDGEKTFQDAGAGQRLAAMDRRSQSLARGAPRGANQLLHASSESQ